MTNIFMKSPLPNTLAVVVLVALIITWVTSIAVTMRDTPIQTERGWFARVLPLFSLLGIPATLDLLQTRGITSLFAGILLIVFLLHVVIPFVKASGKSSKAFVQDWYKWAILISAIGGLIVAGYLTFVESSGAQIVCGPSQGCSEVQNSKYATLFGILPIGILGLAGYVAILIAWFARYYGPERLHRPAALSLWAMCIFGVLFSIYLTFLEPFVIGATCMWCICSAVLMIILLWASTPEAQQVFAMPDEADQLQNQEL